MRKVLIGILLLVMSTASMASSTGVAALADGRANVMECSHEEVVAYMALPDPGRRVLKDYDAWQAAYISAEMVRAEDDPKSCIGLIYGDLSAMADNIKSATQGLASISFSDIASQLGDMMLESVCDRVEHTISETNAMIVGAVDQLRSEALDELNERYGQPAMEGLVTDAVVPPELQSMGVKYRNGEVNPGQFRSKVRSRWTKELDELKD